MDGRRRGGVPAKWRRMGKRQRAAALHDAAALRGGPGARKHPNSAQKGRLDCPSRVRDPHLWGRGNVRALRQQRPTRSKGFVRFGGWFCVVFWVEKGRKTALYRFA